MYEVYMEPNWNEAPDDATHHLVGVQGGLGWWIKIDNDGSYHHRMVNFHIWTHNHKNFIETYENDNWVITPRPQIQPKQQGEHKMFRAKQLKDTYPHKQMRLYIEATVAEAAKRPAALGRLVKKFMANCEEQLRGRRVPDDVDTAFTWANTPEGHDFWSIINDHRPKKEVKAIPVMPGFEDVLGHMPPVAPVAPKKEAKAAPQPAPKQVGWW